MIRLRAVLALAAGLALAAPAAAHGQGRGPKAYKVSADHAGSVVREVLDQHGWVFVRFEDRGADRIVYYRRGNRGRGKGLGPVEAFVIRRVDRQIVFVDVPDLILVDIDVRLRL
jgi:catechol 2,3-dioxygenase-like lactoylglutathione lyase family enzyme